MTKTEFYQLYGHLVEVINPDDAEYGDHMILAREEDHIAIKYEEQGHKVFTIYEEAEEGGDEFVEEGLDLATSPFKVGYLILKKEN